MTSGWRKRGAGIKHMNTTQTQVRSTDEALKLALEALEICEIDGYIPVRLTRESITAIKEALAQPEQGVSNEQVEPTCWITPDGEGFRMRMTPPVNDVPLGWTPLFDHPPVPTAQPEQPKVEPVDYKEQARKGCGSCSYQYCDYPDCVKRETK